MVMNVLASYIYYKWVNEDADLLILCRW